MDWNEHMYGLFWIDSRINMWSFFFRLYFLLFPFFFFHMNNNVVHKCSTSWISSIRKNVVFSFLQNMWQVRKVGKDTFFIEMVHFHFLETWTSPLCGVVHLSEQVSVKVAVPDYCADTLCDFSEHCCGDSFVLSKPDVVNTRFRDQSRGEWEVARPSRVM